MCPRRSAAAVELPVEKRKGDVVRHPHDDRCLEQLARGVRDPPAVDEVVDQGHGSPHRLGDQHRDEEGREHPKRRRPTIDLARVGDDECQEQCAFDARGQPLRPRSHVRRHQKRENHRDENSSGHGPARLAHGLARCDLAPRGLLCPARSFGRVEEPTGGVVCPGHHSVVGCSASWCSASSRLASFSRTPSAASCSARPPPEPRRIQAAPTARIAPTSGPAT